MSQNQEELLITFSERRKIQIKMKSNEGSHMD